MTSDERSAKIEEALTKLLALISHAPKFIEPDVNGTYNQRVEAGFTILAVVPEKEPKPDKWATLEIEDEATGCYPCDTCSGYRARGQPCMFCRAALAAKETP